MVLWNFDRADMTMIIEMKNRTRLTKFAKELVHLPCMSPGADIAVCLAEMTQFKQSFPIATIGESRRA